MRIVIIAMKESVIITETTSITDIVSNVFAEKNMFLATDGVLVMSERGTKRCLAVGKSYHCQSE